MAMILLFGGAIMVVVGGESNLLFNCNSSQTFGILVSFIVSWLYSYNYILTRKLSRVHWSVILFYTCAIGLVCSSVFLIFEAIYNNALRIHTW
jgi:drug/metabolite transporter (DMT)-like permease